jgi:hypothetical protein
VGAFFVAEIPFDRGDQVGDQVRPALQLHVDPAPRLGHPLAQRHQLVVDRHRPHRDQHDEADQHNHHNRFTHGSTPCPLR